MTTGKIIITAIIIAAIISVAQLSARAADKYKFNPFSGKLDNVGDAAIQSGYSGLSKNFSDHTSAANPHSDSQSASGFKAYTSHDRAVLRQQATFGNVSANTYYGQFWGSFPDGDGGTCDALTPCVHQTTSTGAHGGIVSSNQFIIYTSAQYDSANTTQYRRADGTNQTLTATGSGSGLTKTSNVKFGNISGVNGFFAANLGIGTSSFGTSAARVLAIGSGTAPTTSGTGDMIQAYSADLNGVAGDAALHISPEKGQQGFVHKFGSFFQTVTTVASTAVNYVFKATNLVKTKLATAFIAFTSMDETGAEYVGASIGTVFTNHSTTKQQGYLAFDLVSSAATTGFKRKMTIDSNGTTTINGQLVIGGDNSGITFANRSSILSGYLKRGTIDTMSVLNASSNNSLGLAQQNVMWDSWLASPSSWLYSTMLGSGTLNTTLGGVGALLINPIYNISGGGTSGTTDLKISRTQTALGTGNNYLIDAGVLSGETHTSLFVVDNTGKLGIRTGAPDRTVQVVGTAAFGNASASSYGRMTVTDTGTMIPKGSAGSGMVYGSFYGDDTTQNVTTTLTTTYYEVGGSQTTGLLNGMTFQNSKELLCGYSGRYLVNWSMSARSNGSDQALAGAVMIDGAVAHVTENASLFKENGIVYAVGGTGIVACNAGQTISLGVRNYTTAGAVVTITHSNLTTWLIGGP